MLPFRVAKHLVFHSHRSRNPLFQRGLNFALLTRGPTYAHAIIASIRAHVYRVGFHSVRTSAHVLRCTPVTRAWERTQHPRPRTIYAWPPAQHTHAPSTGPGHADNVHHRNVQRGPPELATKRVRFATYPQRWPGPNVWSPTSKRADLVDAQHSSVATFSWQSNPMRWPAVVVAQSVTFGHPTAGVWASKSPCIGRPRKLRERTSVALGIHVRSCGHPSSTCDYPRVLPGRPLASIRVAWPSNV